MTFFSPLTTKIQVPVGARYVGIPGTESEENPRGVMVEVQWEQDDTGSLCISGHSPETPVPPSIPRMPSLRRRSRRVKGVVIDPNEIASNADR